MELTDKEVGQILAALRFWPKGGWSKGEAIQALIEEHGDLTSKEIDALCEKLNCG